MPSGGDGIVIHTERFARRMSLDDVQRKALDREIKAADQDKSAKVAEQFQAMILEMESVLGRTLYDSEGGELGRNKDPRVVVEQAVGRSSSE